VRNACVHQGQQDLLVFALLVEDSVGDVNYLQECALFVLLAEVAEFNFDILVFLTLGHSRVG